MASAQTTGSVRPPAPCWPAAPARRICWTSLNRSWPHISRPPRHHRRHLAHARWEAGYCAYSRHHASRLDRVDTALTDLPGLTLTGDWLRGASIEACFRAARERVAAATR